MSGGAYLKAEFEVVGHFYEAHGHKLRKYLDIKRVGAREEIPDLMVVMMNPGSSYPLDNNDNNVLPSKAEPDTTQQQVIKVMNKASFNYARVLNLSDLRTPSSDDLYAFLKSEEAKSVDHSIFSFSRKSELDQLLIKNVPVIFAWGVNPALVPFAKLAIDVLGIDNSIGMLKHNTKYSYYHPLPKVYAKQLEWVRYITDECIRKRQFRASI